ncbi:MULTISPECIES: hypothetical protein [Gordonia]|uniref:hypothetical protein n=1 Tax=Gordonia TaxID=2053 RepID=UPI00257EDDDE|nr:MULTISPECIES: hypothetical protein [Gordonia]
MEPVTLVAAAVAIGASEGARDTTKKVISDAYTALRNWLTNKYVSVSAEISGLEAEPDEELRRALLAKKLAAAGASEDMELLELAHMVLEAVEQQEPSLPRALGVALRRASVGGDIEVVNVSVDGGSGVIAEDIAANGSVRIGGVSARAAQEPPHPPRARER